MNGNTFMNKLELDEIRDKVKQFTGIDVKNLGRVCGNKGRLAKQMFWRVGFLHCYNGKALSEYCGMKNRGTSSVCRNLYVKKCKTDNSLRFEWELFKKSL